MQYGNQIMNAIHPMKYGGSALNYVFCGTITSELKCLTSQVNCQADTCIPSESMYTGHLGCYWVSSPVTQRFCTLKPGPVFYLLT